MTPYVTIYACAMSKDGRYGGIGAVLTAGQHKKEISKHFSMEVTQNQVEISCLIKCLEQVKKNCNISVYIDSKCMVRMINDGWPHKWQQNDWLKEDGEEVQNSNLWKLLIPQLERHKNVGLRWCGELDNKYYLRSKELCFAALEKAQRFA